MRLKEETIRLLFIMFGVCALTIGIRHYNTFGLNWKAMVSIILGTFFCIISAYVKGKGGAKG